METKINIPEPNVDLLPLCKENAEENDIIRIGKVILKAFEDHGFIYVKNCGPTYENVEDFVSAGNKLFNLDDNIKNKCRKEVEVFHGYSNEKMEIINTEISPSERTHRDNFHIKDFVKPFPEEVPELKTTSKTIIDKILPTARNILRSLESALDVSPGYFIDKHKYFMQPENLSCMRVTRYSSPTGEEQTIRFEEHCDFTTITIQLYADLEGLQLLDRQGNWCKSKLCDGYALFFPGEMLQFMTGDRIQATKHKVLVPEDKGIRKKPRHAVIFFMAPDNDATLSPFDGSDKYSPVTANEFSLSRINLYYNKNIKK